MNPQKSIWVAGVARSGTSWIGQIFNSHPKVRFRFQPLFSYEFKSRINENSSQEEFVQFVEDLWSADSSFLTQADKVAAGEYPEFKKSGSETTLVFKENRYLSVIEPMLRRTPSLNVIGVVRNPCAVMHSWSRNDREFPKSAVLRDEWRFGACKNSGPEDYFGFYKWKEIANLFLDLVAQYPQRMQVVFYDEIVSQTIAISEQMLRRCGLDFDKPVEQFLNESGNRHSDNYYSVFKTKASQNDWQKTLDPYIVDEIHRDLAGTRLEQFLHC